MRRIVAAAIINEEKILIAKRNYGSLAGYWEFPGGKLEAEETDIECICREIQEEFLVDIDVEKYLGQEIFFVNDKKYEIVLYQAQLLSGDIQLTVHSEVAWVKKEDLTKYKLAPVDEQLVKNIWRRA